MSTQADNSIDVAFENAILKAMTTPNLTLRQKLWIAFDAGGQYALNAIGAKHGVDLSAPGAEIGK